MVSSAVAASKYQTLAKTTVLLDGALKACVEVSCVKMGRSPPSGYFCLYPSIRSLQSNRFDLVLKGKRTTARNDHRKLYETLLLVIKLDKHLGLQTGVEKVRDSLANIASAPAQPQHQTALALALQAFDEATEKLGHLLSPSQISAIEEIGGGEFFTPSIANKVHEAISDNPMTPSVARDFVLDLAKRRADFLEICEQTSDGLNSLGVESDQLSPGAADIAFLIPRDIFDNNLEQFANELRFINRLVRDFTEATTGSVGIVELEKLSSSVPTVAIGAGIEIVAKIADVVSKFLSAWQKIEEIRDVKQRLSKIGFKGVAVEQLNEEITTTIEEVVEESTEMVLSSYPGESTRKNELATAIKQDTRRLFGQIERGLVVQFRAEPKEKPTEKEEVALSDVKRINSEIFFPEVPQEPLLLSSDHIIEGEIPVIVIKRSVKKNKTTTTKVKKVLSSE